MNYYRVGYFSRRIKAYTYKVIKANTPEEAVRKSRVKNIEGITLVAVETYTVKYAPGVYIPDDLKKRIEENVTIYLLGEGDAVKEAFGHFCRNGAFDPNSKLYKAWYYSDFREFVPEIYISKYLDFEKYPLAYE